MSSYIGKLAQHSTSLSALVQDGYVFSTGVYDQIVERFDDQSVGLFGLDTFLQAYTVVTNLAGNFRKMDPQLTNTISLSFDEYIMMVMLYTI